MRVRRDRIGRATVRCPNWANCRGEIAVTVYEEIFVTPSGSTARMFHGESVEQSCACELSEDQWEDVVDDAQTAPSRSQAPHGLSPVRGRCA